MADLTAEFLLDTLSDAERAIATRVESVLPSMAAAAVEADRLAEFPLQHVATFREAGLLGLPVPVEFGGLGGGLRDLAAATFAMGTACPSTALAYFFQCSSASRGLLPLRAIEAGLFTDDEIPAIRAFATEVLERLGTRGRWMANFASESVKSEASAITLATRARPTVRDGVTGWALEGEKSFGCATGVADDYLVSAMIGDGTTAASIGTFLVERTSPGVRDRARWDAIGMRASATHGIVLEDVFVPAELALTVEGAFVRMTQVSRGSFVGSQLAGTAVYLGAAKAVADFALGHLRTTTFADTGRPIGSAGFQQQLIGEMQMHLDTATLWLRRQLELETSDPPLRPKDEVVREWRIAKGTIAEEAFAVATCALKACGTGHTANTGIVARMLRDLSMGLVQAFPPERGRLEAATALMTGGETSGFGGAPR